MNSLYTETETDSFVGLVSPVTVQLRSYTCCRRGMPSLAGAGLRQRPCFKLLADTTSRSRWQCVPRRLFNCCVFVTLLFVERTDITAALVTLVRMYIVHP